MAFVQKRTVLERVVERCLIGDGCWEWQGGKSHDGYARISVNGRGSYAHRALWEFFHGPVPEGLELDHLCGNRGCVRPGHLEAVTGRVNKLRSRNQVAGQARQTSCIHGHPFDEENTYRWRGHRGCRTCRTARNRARSHG